VYFLTEKEWELRDPILRSLLGTGARIYPCVEIELNGPLWHLDLLFSWPDDITCWRRFILTSVEQVVAIVAEHKGQCRIHFQDARVESKAYQIHHVDALSEGTCEAGGRAFIVTFSDRSLVLPDDSVAVSTIKNVRDLFIARKLPSEGSV
jgi:hypothetical protein